MDETLKIIIVLLLIAAFIISVIFASISVYDYFNMGNIDNIERNQEFIDNCKIGQDLRDKATELIQNNTHIFQQQSCTWIKVNNDFVGIPMEK